MPERMSEEMPERMPEKLPQDMPERMPEDIPGRMADRMSGDSQRMSDRISQRMSDRMLWACLILDMFDFQGGCGYLEPIDCFNAFCLALSCTHDCDLVCRLYAELLSLVLYA